MSHYETLGIASDADGADIRRAYRRKASECHPDKGGTDEEMQKVNRAFEVLSNPELRANYDATGSDTVGTSVEDEARNFLIQQFNAALDQETKDTVRFVKDAIDDVKGGANLKVRIYEEQERKMLQRRPKIKRDGDRENLAHAVIDMRINLARENVRQAKHILQIVEAASKMLDGYEADDAAKQQVYHSVQHFGNTYSSGLGGSIFGAGVF